MARKGASKKSERMPVLTGKSEKLRAQLPHKRKLFMIFQTLNSKSRPPVCAQHCKTLRGPANPAFMHIRRTCSLDARVP